MVTPTLLIPLVFIFVMVSVCCNEQLLGMGVVTTLTCGYVVCPSLDVVICPFRIIIPKIILDSVFPFIVSKCVYLLLNVK